MLQPFSVVGSVATFDFVHSSINCVYIIIYARVKAMWLSSRLMLLYCIKILAF